MKQQQYSNLYPSSAHIYDLDNQEIVFKDITFYQDLAQELGGPILELACGTGRVTIPLAEMGLEIWGLDLSKPMLKEFSGKLPGLDPTVASRIHILQSDMCSFQIGKTFRMIFIAFRSFQSLIADQQQKACLKCVHDHLTESGRFVVDVSRPFDNIAEVWVAPEKMDWERTDPRSGAIVRRFHTRKHIDLENQVIHPEFRFQTQFPNGSSQEFIERLELKYYYQDQIERLLRSTGFEIEASYGDFDRRKIGEGGEQIFVCRKSGQA